MPGMFSKSEEITPLETSGSQTTLGTTVHIEGTIQSDENIVISGTINGSITTSKNIHVNAGARITADISAQDLLISGEITGNIRAAGTVTLTQTARVVGDVNAAHIAIEHGAQLKGQMSTQTTA